MSSLWTSETSDEEEETFTTTTATPMHHQRNPNTSPNPTNQISNPTHVNKIQNDGDYLHRLVRTGKAEEFAKALDEWETHGHVKPLLLPDCNLNPAAVKSKSAIPDVSLITAAAASSNNDAILIHIVRYFLNSNTSIDASVLKPLLSNDIPSEFTHFLYAHSEHFQPLQTNPAKDATTKKTTTIIKPKSVLSPTLAKRQSAIRIEPISFQHPSRRDAIEECVRMIGTHDPKFKETCEQYIKKNKYPLFNSCGYIPIGADVIYSQTLGESTSSNHENVTLKFKYKNNQSLFRYALECNNIRAFRVLLDLCSQNFKDSSFIPPLFETIQAENKLDVAPWMITQLRANLSGPPQKKIIHQQLLSHPITGKSIFEILFERILNLQRFHNEYEFDQRVSMSSQQQQQPLQTQQDSATNNDVSSTKSVGGQQQQQPPTAPNIYRVFHDILHISILIIWLTVDLYSLEDTGKAIQFWQQHRPRISAQTNPVPPPDPTIVAKATVMNRIASLFDSFARAATVVCDSIQTATIPNSAALSHLTIGAKLRKDNKSDVSSSIWVPALDYIEEYCITMVVHFIPYQTPQAILMGFEQLPKIYIPLLNQLMPKLPSHFFRKDTSDVFKVHGQLYQYRSNQCNPQATSKLPQPQILTATHLRLPMYIATLSPLNVYPTEPTKAAQMYKLHNWDSSSIHDFQSKRLLMFQTQLTHTQRAEVSPIVLLKFHPIAIVQALYLYANPQAHTYENPVFQLLLEQVAECLTTDSHEIQHFSIISNADSVRVKALADNNVPVPTHIIPIICPTLIDFIYLCRHRKTTNSNEKAYYYQYIYQMINALNFKKDDDRALIKAISEDSYDNINQLNNAANKWVPTNEYLNCAKFLTTAFMTGQTRKSMSEVCSPTNMRTKMDNYANDIDQGLILTMDGLFVPDADLSIQQGNQTNKMATSNALLHRIAQSDQNDEDSGSFLQQLQNMCDDGDEDDDNDDDGNQPFDWDQIAHLAGDSDSD